MKLSDVMSMEKKNLRYKMIIAFSLMSVIPLLIMTYFVVTYVVEVAESPVQVMLIVLSTLWAVFLGFILIRQIIRAVIDIASESSIIASGKYDEEVSFISEDELGDIAQAVNRMTGRIRSYIGELQNYGRKTAELNRQVHKKVLTLADLMQMGDLITEGSGFEQIAGFAAEKLADVLDQGICGVFMKERTGSYSAQSFVNNSEKDIVIEDIEKALYYFDRALGKNEFLSVDSRPITKPWQAEMRERLKLGNVLLVPLKLGPEIIGAVLLSNFEGSYEFNEDDVKIAVAFEKELVLGYQNSRLFEKVKKVEVVDSVTGLYTRAYLEDRLEDEINRAMFYQRPCSLIMMDLDRFDEYTAKEGQEKADLLLKQVGKLLNEMMPTVGKIARFTGSEFGILLLEKNKREAIEFAERMLEQMNRAEISEKKDEKVKISVGVGENPLDGIKAADIINKAYQNLDKARQLGGDKVIGD